MGASSLFSSGLWKNVVIAIAIIQIVNANTTPTTVNIFFFFISRLYSPFYDSLGNLLLIFYWKLINLFHKFHFLVPQINQKLMIAHKIPTIFPITNPLSISLVQVKTYKEFPIMIVAAKAIRILYFNFIWIF